MIDFTFILNPGRDDLYVDEPVGWADIDLEIIRDPKNHGVSVAYGLSDLQFTGAAADFLREQYELYGVDADVEIFIGAGCNGITEWGETFRLDFGQYGEGCDTDCAVTIGIEQVSCFQRFSSNLDKKVDLDQTTSFNGVAVRPLPGMRRAINLPAKSLLKSAEGYVREGSAPVEAVTDGWDVLHHVRPIFTDTRYESIKTSNLADPEYSTIDAGQDLPAVTPFLLWEDDPSCFTGTLDVGMRMKGTVTITSQGRCRRLFFAFIRAKGPYGDPATQTVLQTFYVIQDSAVVATGEWTEDLDGQSRTYAFDIEYYDPAMELEEGDAIYGVAEVYYEGAGGDLTTTSILFDKDTFVRIEAAMLCPPSAGYVYLPYEVIQRVADVITDGCLRLESSWYGRTDTPVVYDRDGCGALRSLTGGLYLRGVPEAKLFVGMKELLEGLQPIDAIGFGMERDEDGKEVLRVEAVEYFYQDVELFRIDGVRSGKMKVIPSEVVGIIRVGYDKWQPEAINGLDEFNSTREYRTSLVNASNPVDLVSKFIAGGYIIEQARQQSFVKSGGQDTRYDNDMFVIQLRREGSMFYVEQGVPEGADVFDPATALNFRLSPVRNLMRWWPLLAGRTFRDIEDGSFVFTSGTGNYTAAGRLSDDCSPEAALIRENDTIDAGRFTGDEGRRGLVRAESVTFEAPLSLQEFSSLRANPYGFISYQCGNGEWRKGYITKITYRIGKGIASFDLRNKYE